MEDAKVIASAAKLRIARMRARLVAAELAVLEAEEAHAENVLEAALKRAHEPIETIRQTEQDSNENLTNSCDDVVVCKTNNVSGQRRWDKKHCCAFCDKLVSKLPRHLAAMHGDQVMVQEFLKQPVSSAERKRLTENLRQRGNFAHNSKTLSANSGLIIPKKRSSKDRSVESFAPCKSCKGMFSKKHLYSHYRRCSNSVRRVRKCAAPFPTVDSASVGLRDGVLASMHQDRIYHIIRKDRLILKYGSCMHERHVAHPHLIGRISFRMRELGRLVECLRDVDKGIVHLEDLIQPKCYNSFVAAVKSVAAFDDQTNEFGNPSLALSLRTSVHRLCKYFKNGLHTCRRGSPTSYRR